MVILLLKTIICVACLIYMLLTLTFPKLFFLQKILFQHFCMIFFHYLQRIIKGNMLIYKIFSSYKLTSYLIKVEIKHTFSSIFYWCHAFCDISLVIYNRETMFTFSTYDIGSVYVFSYFFPPKYFYTDQLVAATSFAKILRTTIHLQLKFFFWLSTIKDLREK